MGKLQDMYDIFRKFIQYVCKCQQNDSRSQSFFNVLYGFAFIFIEISQKTVDNFKQNTFRVRVGPKYGLGLHANQFSKNPKNNLTLFLRCFYVVSHTLLDNTLFQYIIVYIYIYSE